MVRKGAFVLLAIAVGAIGYFGYSIYNRVQEKKAVKQRIATLPAFKAASLNSDSVSSRALLDGKPFVVTYFSPECHFCQHEIKSMEASNRLRQKANIWLISDFPRAALQQFNTTFQVDTTNNLHIYWDRDKKVKKLFGVAGVPSTFVYGKDGKLLKHFKGETKAEAIYNSINTGRGLLIPAGDFEVLPHLIAVVAI